MQELFYTALEFCISSCNPMAGYGKFELKVHVKAGMEILVNCTSDY